MIYDLLHETPSPVEFVDLCVVGAGAVGITLAVEAAGKGKRVLLLEGGGAIREESSQALYDSEVAGLPHRGIHTGRIRVKGGTTVRWGGQILELDAHDFCPRPGVPESGWPFSKDTLTPFYERALSLEGLAKVERSDAEVWRDLGLPFTQFDDLEAYLSRWCPEPNFARLHHRALAEDPTIKLWLHASAVELMTQNGVATGVRCRTLTGVEALFHASHYIFALGGIESSRFFLQPRAGGLPWNRSGLLGQHFQDHIDCNAAAIEPLDPKRFHDTFDPIFAGGFKYLPKLRLRPQVQVALGSLNVGSTIAFEDTGKLRGQAKTTVRNLMRGRFSEITRDNLRHTVDHLPMLAHQAWRYKVQRRAYSPPEVRIFLRVHCEQEPTSRSSVTLTDHYDPLGLLRIRFDWQISERELDTIRQYVLIAQRVLSGVARILPNEDLVSGSPKFLDRCDDSNHHMGGMRMSPSDESGVVDTDLRLFGVANTYICSSAVFPSSGFSNPTHTVLALALRLSDHLG
ncbi:GMC family oxidoreductase [Granulicella sp. S190]|uniref:GMC family oxidoreductase n=1 Tax=Granulicella sp. S190 TaxID=1747226 RepID=UPI00131C64EA|nr:GMC family oxidoreductase [Granulicella sp. S190]